MSSIAVSERALRVPRAGIRVIFDAAQKYEGVIHLEIGQPDLPTPPEICRAAEQAIEAGETRYTPNAGSLKLRQAISSMMARRRGLDISTGRIVVTTGGMGALASAVQAMIDTGDEALIPDPGWPNYHMQITCAGGVSVPYPLRPENGFQPAVEDIEARLTPRTRLLFVNSPSNPIGVVYRQEKVDALLELARRRNLMILSDEVYNDICFTGSCPSFLRQDTESFVMAVYSFSKTYSMTGWRVGYLVAPEPVAAQVTKLQEVFYACTSSVSQAAAEAALRMPDGYLDEMNGVYHRRRNALVRILTENGIGHFAPEGAFYCLLQVGQANEDSTQLALEILDRTQVAVAPGETFGEFSRGMVRVSFAVEDGQLEEGISKLAKYLASRPAQ